MLTKLGHNPKQNFLTKFKDKALPLQETLYRKYILSILFKYTSFILQILEAFK